jgi:alpha-1,3-glucosyltransferase
VDNLNYASDATVLFQRVSVITTDLVLAIAAVLWVSDHPKPVQTFILIVFNSGLLMVDHIHFKYNGLLLGILLLVLFCAKHGWYVLLTMLFSILVLMKHLFAPLAPIFAVYLLRKSLDASSGSNSSAMYTVTVLTTWLQHVIVAVTALAVAFGPFIAAGGKEQVEQIFSRLFPFQRGLVHAYWAPNLWALYCAADKAAIIISKKILHQDITLSSDNIGLLSSTSGKVGEFAFVFLPKVSAQLCLMLVLLSLLPACFAIYRRPNITQLVRCLVYASMSSFMLGYHVHEKAIIIPWLLQTLICTVSPQDRLLCFALTAIGGTSLLPLLPGQFECCIKSKSVFF